MNGTNILAGLCAVGGLVVAMVVWPFHGAVPALMVMLAGALIGGSIKNSGGSDD